MKHFFKLLIVALTLFSCKNDNQKKVEDYFSAANDRLKDIENPDSLTISQCISDYTSAINLNPEFWQAYSNRA